MPPPPADVSAAFGMTGRPEPLAGGQRTVWRVGTAVFKRLDSAPRMVAWQAEVLQQVGPDAGVRVAPPLSSATGAFVVDGWTATPYLPGRPAGDDWPAIIAAGCTLHRALRTVPRPPMLDEREDAWAVADRIVWDLAAPAPDPQLTAAFAARRPVDLTEQLVHGDLTGNVLLADDDAPAVVDLSPYWRPPQWATAVVCADALLFAHADSTAVFAAAQAAAGSAPNRQVLLRAVLFRIVTAMLLGRPLSDETARGMHSALVLAITPPS